MLINQRRECYFTISVSPLTVNVTPGLKTRHLSLLAFNKSDFANHLLQNTFYTIKICFYNWGYDCFKLRLSSFPYMYTYTVHIKATRFLHPSMFFAASKASSHVSPNPRISSRMVSSQFFLDLPFPSFLRSQLHYLFGSSIIAYSSQISQPRNPFLSNDTAQLLLSSFSLTIMFGVLSINET